MRTVLGPLLSRSIEIGPGAGKHGTVATEHRDDVDEEEGDGNEDDSEGNEPLDGKAICSTEATCTAFDSPNFTLAN